MSPEQDLAPWVEALATLLNDRETYTRCASESRVAALSAIAPHRVQAFEELVASIDAS